MFRREHAQKLRFRAEMQQQPDFEIGRPQIIVELTLGDGMEYRRRLHFNDNCGIDDEVETLEAERLSLVPDLHCVLARHVVAGCAQISFKRRAIQALQESIPERAVHFVEQADDSARQFVVREVVFSHAGRCPARQQ